jgi:membrane protein
MLKGLFSDNQKGTPVKLQANYLQKLLQRYGKSYQHKEYIFSQGDLTRNLHYLVNGQVQIIRHGKVIRTIEAGEYFGEMALLSNMPTIADAVVSSTSADVVIIYPENIETLLLDEPKVAMKFLRQLATRLQIQNNTDAS